MNLNNSCFRPRGDAETGSIYHLININFPIFELTFNTLSYWAIYSSIILH